MRSLRISGLVLSLVLSGIVSGSDAACTVCHSKNPKMVKMNEALGFKDCFSCHGPKSRRVPGPQKEQMQKDPLCMNCHKD